MRQPIDRQLGHGDGQRRLRGNFPGKHHSGIKGGARVGHLLHQAPFIRLRGADALVGQDHRLFGSSRSDQMQHAWNALPAHVHAEANLGHAQMGVAAHDPKIQRDRQRHAAADAKPLNGSDRDLLHFVPGLGQPRPQLEVPPQ